MYLAAVWLPRGLELYDTDSWSEPEVEASASHEAMAGAFPHRCLYVYVHLLDNQVHCLSCSAINPPGPEDQGDDRTM